MENAYTIAHQIVINGMMDSVILAILLVLLVQDLLGANVYHVGNKDSYQMELVFHLAHGELILIQLIMSVLLAILIVLLEWTK